MYYCLVKVYSISMVLKKKLTNLVSDVRFVPIFSLVAHPSFFSIILILDDTAY